MPDLLRDAAAAAQADRAEIRRDPERIAQIPVAALPGVADQLRALGRELGLLEAFADRALPHQAEKTRPWPGVGLTRGADDPHLLRQYGRFAARLIALDALFTAAAADLAAGHPEARRAIALARRLAAQLGGAGISDTIALLGASAAAGHHGFHLFWQGFQSHRHNLPAEPPGPPHTLTDYLERELLQ